MQFLNTLKKKHSDLPFHNKISLSDPKFLKFNGSFQVIHIDVEIDPCILILAQSQEQLNTLKIEHKNDGVFIYSKGTVINQNIKPIGFFKKLKFLFCNNSNNVITTNNGPIIYVCTPKLPYTKIIGSCLFEAKNIKQDDLQIDLFGSGQLDLGGRVLNFRTELDGSGLIDGKKLFSQNINVKLDGSGYIDVRANYSADVELSGSGLITISDKPSRTSFKKSGSGLINCKK